MSVLGNSSSGCASRSVFGRPRQSKESERHGSWFGEKTDVVVIGLGPAGIVASSALAEAGNAGTALQTTPGVRGRRPVVSPVVTVRRLASDRAEPASEPQHGADAIGGSKLLAAPQSHRLDPWTLRADAGSGRRRPPAGRVPRRPDVRMAPRRGGRARAPVGVGPSRPLRPWPGDPRRRRWTAREESPPLVLNNKGVPDVSWHNE
jgi:hypothetical protein